MRYRSPSAAKTAAAEATGTNALDGSKVVYRRKANIVVMLAPMKRLIDRVERALRGIGASS